MNLSKLISFLTLFSVSTFAATNEPSIVLTPILGNCENGYGKAVWEKGGPEGMPQGTTYEGYFKNKLPDRFGKISHPEYEFVVVGEFKDGKQNGFAVLLESNKFVYAGMMVDCDFTNELNISVGKFGGYFLTTTNKSVIRLWPEGELEHQQIYKITPTVDTNSVTGILIPNNLKECFLELENSLTPEFIDEIKQGTEADMNQFHHSLGMFLRNNWGLWKGSALSEWFNEKGIHHPDDMSGIIFDSFWRHLNNKPIKLEEQIKFYKDYWERAKKEESNNSSTLR